MHHAIHEHRLGYAVKLIPLALGFCYKDIKIGNVVNELVEKIVVHSSHYLSDQFLTIVFNLLFACYLILHRFKYNAGT
jgi:hypothetical protein